MRIPLPQLCPASAGHFYVDWDRVAAALRTSSPSAFDETRADGVGDNSEDHELNTGAQWHMLPQSYPNYKTVHRRFQAWCGDEILRRVVAGGGYELRGRGGVGEEKRFIDGAVGMGKGGGGEDGGTKHGKSVENKGLVDTPGLPPLGN